MPTIRIQHAFQDQNGNSEDRYMNTWHGLSTLQPADPELEDIATALRAFYDSIQSHLATHIDGPGRNIKMFNMDDAVPRQPIYDVFDDPTPFSGPQAFPSEVACCLSFEGNPAPGVNQARHRGRVYIGPLVRDTSAQGGVDLPARPTAVFRNAVLNAAFDLQAAWQAIDNFTWCAHSEIAGTSVPVTRAWMDDAWDTQRRRGVAPTGQISLVIP